MNRLQYALQRAVEADERFRGRDGRPSYRQAAQACRLSSNVISNYVNTPHPPLPTLETLLAYTGTFGWPLCDVVYWALDRDPPLDGPDAPLPLRTDALLREWGLPDHRRQLMLELAQEWASSSGELAPRPESPPTRSGTRRS